MGVFGSGYLVEHTVRVFPLSAARWVEYISLYLLWLGPSRRVNLLRSLAWPLLLLCVRFFSTLLCKIQHLISIGQVDISRLFLARFSPLLVTSCLGLLIFGVVVIVCLALTLHLLLLQHVPFDVHREPQDVDVASAGCWVEELISERIIFLFVEVFGIDAPRDQILVELGLLRVENVLLELVDRTSRVPERVLLELVPTDPPSRILLKEIAQQVIEVIRKVGD